MLIHYTGSYMFLARGKLEDGKYKEADQYRVELLDTIKTLRKTQEVVSCINYLEKAKWNSSEDVDKFEEFFDKRDERMQKHKDLIKKLFGH